MSWHWGLDQIPSNLLDVCKVSTGASITVIAHSYTPTLLYAGYGDLIVEYISTLITWGAGGATFLVAIKSLSGKPNIGEALKYFWNGFRNLFKKK